MALGRPGFQFITFGYACAVHIFLILIATGYSRCLPVDWMHSSLSDFIRGPVMRTPEGLLFALGSTVSLLFALLTFVEPTILGMKPELMTGMVMLFAFWPICLLVIFVFFNAPHFRPSLFTSSIMVVAVAFPFYLVYG